LKIDHKYINSGFQIIESGKHTWAIKYGGDIIFTFNTDLDLGQDFFNRLCETYLTLQAIKSDIRA
jgi:hypothetical protein